MNAGTIVTLLFAAGGVACYVGWRSIMADIRRDERARRNARIWTRLVEQDTRRKSHWN